MGTPAASASTSRMGTTSVGPTSPSAYMARTGKSDRGRCPHAVLVTFSRLYRLKVTSVNPVYAARSVTTSVTAPWRCSSACRASFSNSRWAGALSLAIVAVKRRTPRARARGAKLVHEQGPESAALPVVGHDHGHLGRLGVVGKPHVARDSDQCADRGVGPLGHERHVVAPVDLGQVAQLGAAEARLGSEKAPLDARLGEVVQALFEHALVVRPYRADQDLSAIRKPLEHAPSLAAPGVGLCARPHAPNPARSGLPAR